MGGRRLGLGVMMEMDGAIGEAGIVLESLRDLPDPRGAGTRRILHFAATAPWSSACAPPDLAGMRLARRRSRRIDQRRFRAIVLAVLLVLGLNRLRRALS